MITILLSIDSRYDVDRPFIRKIIRDKLVQQGVSDNAEISLSIVGKRKMVELCKQYMNDGLEHDVLSFPLEDPAVVDPFIKPDAVRRLGDIVVSYPAAVEQASAEHVSVSEKLQQLIEHAIMHLLGEHHDDGIGT